MDKQNLAEGLVDVEQRQKVWFIFEYGPRKDDWMMASLIDAFVERYSVVQPAYLKGLFNVYRPGGLRPARLVNMVWLYAILPLKMLMGRPKLIVVRTTPPCIQLWAAILGGIFSVPVVCWLMDYHPEIEARALEARGIEWIARALRRIDARLMKRFHAVIVLDNEMAKLVHGKCRTARVVVHPTWNISKDDAFRPVSYNAGDNDKSISIAYTGNLGVAHQIESLGVFLEQIRSRRRVVLHAIGTGDAGVSRFRELCLRFDIELRCHPRTDFKSLGELYSQLKVDVGIVVLSARYAGLVSPSKYTGYITFGLPILYFGPSGTNAAEVCNRFGAGLQIDETASLEAITQVVDQLISVSSVTIMKENTRNAADYFCSLNGETLLDALSIYVDPLFVRNGAK